MAFELNMINIDQVLNSVGSPPRRLKEIYV